MDEPKTSRNNNSERTFQSSFERQRHQLQKFNNSYTKITRQGESHRGKGIKYSKIKDIGGIPTCTVKILNIPIDVVTDTGSQISVSMFNKCFQQHTLLQNSFVRLTVVNNVGPYIGHMVYDVTMNDIMLSNCVMYVLKDISRLKKT